MSRSRNRRDRGTDTTDTNTLVISEVGLMPDILGFSMVRVALLGIVCVLLFASSIFLGLWAIPVLLILDALIICIIGASALMTPSHLSITTYFARLFVEAYSQTTAYSDPFIND